MLIDADNAQLSYIEQVLEIAEYYGRLEICRAYGAWKEPQLAPWRGRIDALKIDRVQVDRVGKNATDHRLLMEAGAILGADAYEGKADIFIIVSGDGDFTSSCEWIKEKGKQVIGIGNKVQTASSLRESCNDFHYFKDLENELSELKKRYPIPPSEMREFFSRLVWAYCQLTQKDAWAWVSYDQLGQKLRELVPDYKSKFGKHKLSEWISSLDEYFESRDQMVRRINPDPDNRYSLMIKAYIQTSELEKGLAHLGALGKKLRELDPDYERRFGSKKLSEWIEDYPDMFRIRDDYVIHKSHW